MNLISPQINLATLNFKHGIKTGVGVETIYPQPIMDVVVLTTKTKLEDTKRETKEFIFSSMWQEIMSSTEVQTRKTSSRQSEI